MDPAGCSPRGSVLAHASLGSTLGLHWPGAQPRLPQRQGSCRPSRADPHTWPAGLSGPSSKGLKTSRRWRWPSLPLGSSTLHAAALPRRGGVLLRSQSPSPFQLLHSKPGHTGPGRASGPCPKCLPPPCCGLQRQSRLPLAQDALEDTLLHGALPPGSEQMRWALLLWTCEPWGRRGPSLAWALPLSGVHAGCATALCPLVGVSAIHIRGKEAPGPRQDQAQGDSSDLVIQKVPIIAGEWTGVDVSGHEWTRLVNAEVPERRQEGTGQLQP